MRSFFRHFSSTLFVRPREIFWGRSIRRIISKRNIEAPLKRFGFLDFWADGGLKIGETQYVPSTEPIRRFTAFLIKSVLRDLLKNLVTNNLLAIVVIKRVAFATLSKSTTTISRSMVDLGSLTSYVLSVRLTILAFFIIYVLGSNKRTL
tara:strand:+ start:13152 stop:13598 length:447 start_codon:yes stop_codon:yes gene_type:complete